MGLTTVRCRQSSFLSIYRNILIYLSISLPFSLSNIYLYLPIYLFLVTYLCISPLLIFSLSFLKYDILQLATSLFLSSLFSYFSIPISISIYVALLHTLMSLLAPDVFFKVLLLHVSIPSSPQSLATSRGQEERC